MTICWDVFQKMAYMWQLDLNPESQENSDLHCLLQVQKRNEARPMEVETQSLGSCRKKELVDSRRNAHYPEC